MITNKIWKIGLATTWAAVWMMLGLWFFAQCTYADTTTLNGVVAFGLELVAGGVCLGCGLEGVKDIMNCAPIRSSDSKSEASLGADQ